MRNRNSGAGSHLPSDTDSITDAILRHYPGRTDINRTMVRNIVTAAESSMRNAEAIRNDPTSQHAVNARDYATDRTIDRRVGQFRYKVIVYGDHMGQRFETLIVMQFKTKKSAEELGRLALARFRANAALQTYYATELARLGGNLPDHAVVIGAARNPG